MQDYKQKALYDMVRGMTLGDADDLIYYHDQLAVFNRFINEIHQEVDLSDYNFSDVLDFVSKSVELFIRDNLEFDFETRSFIEPTVE